MQLNPVGIIHSPFKNRKESQSLGREEICEIEIFEQYGERLKDIEGFSHLILIYRNHQGEVFSLLVETPWGSELNGVFAIRSPNRPNALDGLPDERSLAHSDFENCIILFEKGEIEVSRGSFKNCKLMLGGNAIPSERSSGFLPVRALERTRY